MIERGSLRLVPSAQRFMERARQAESSGTSTEALGWYERAVAAMESAPSAGLADLLRWKGTCHRECGETADAEKLYRRSAEVAANVGYALGEAHAANCLAIVAQRRGDLNRAEVLFGEAMRRALIAEDEPLQAMIEHNLAILSSIRGELSLAEDRYRTCLRRFEAIGDEAGMTQVLNNLGMLLTRQRRLADADGTFIEALGLASARGDLLSQGVLELNRAELCVLSGRLDEAELSCMRALQIASQRGDTLRRAEALRALACVQRSRHEFAACHAALAEALTLSAGAEDQLLQAEIQRDMGDMHAASGAAGAAQGAWSQAIAGFRKMGATRDAAELESRMLELMPARRSTGSSELRS